MKVIILAGGLGTRLSEETKKKPKPLVKINKVPLLGHIIKHYMQYECNSFIIASGYKSFLIKKYVDQIKNNKFFKNISIKSIDTGLKTTTGGRLNKILKLIEDETIMITYGDGLSNVNISQLLKSHKNSKKILTVTAVHPPARFGAMVINSKNVVTKFSEKIVNKNSWINGGFFIAERKKLLPFFSKFNDKSFEDYTLPKLSEKRQINAFKHHGFWHPCDTIRDKNILESFKASPWLKYE